MAQHAVAAADLGPLAEIRADADVANDNQPAPPAPSPRCYRGRTGSRHLISVPRAMLGDAGALRDRLSHYGLQIRPTPAAKGAPDHHHRHVPAPALFHDHQEARQRAPGDVDRKKGPRLPSGPFRHSRIGCRTS
jgi:hypothetical protein